MGHLSCLIWAPSVLTSILPRGGREGPSQEGDVVGGSRGWSGKGPRAEGCGQLGAGQGGSGFRPGASRGASPAHTLVSAQGDPVELLTSRTAR